MKTHFCSTLVKGGHGSEAFQKGKSDLKSASDKIYIYIYNKYNARADTTDVFLAHHLESVPGLASIDGLKKTKKTMYIKSLQ